MLENVHKDEHKMKLDNHVAKMQKLKQNMSPALYNHDLNTIKPGK